jgi:uncharacterized protein
MKPVKRTERGTGRKPFAYSVDARTFKYVTSLDQPLLPGSYVVLINPVGKYCGQIVSGEVIDNANLWNCPISRFLHYLKMGEKQFIHGHGLLLGKICQNGTLKPTDYSDTFSRAVIEKANDDLLRSVLSLGDPRYVRLQIGRALYSEGTVSASVASIGFNRPTFLSGETGCGKTFALGVLIEQLLLNTKLRIVILDPNSDFTQLDEINDLGEMNKSRSLPLSEDEYRDLFGRYDTVTKDISIVCPVSNPSGKFHIKLRFSDLGPAEQAAILRLDPVADRAEFHALNDIIMAITTPSIYTLQELHDAACSRSIPEALQIAERIQNLRIPGWEIWSTSKKESIFDILASDSRCIVFDMGSLSDSEKMCVSAAVLEYHWRSRYTKHEVLVVIDEAHNLCPATPVTPIGASCSDHIIRITGEGRKYGIYPVLVSQVPTKIHANALSQCQNLVLMKNSSKPELDYISQVFSTVPISFINEARFFRRGEALIAGRLVDSPTFVKFEGRLSKEGGKDIIPSWAIKT